MAETEQRIGDADREERCPNDDDAALVAALRAGDEAAFAALLDRYHAAMVRLAMLHVRDRAVAEEVAQEAWVGVLRGLDRFEGRASFKTWLFRILTNQAKRRGVREGRSVPFSALARAEAAGEEPAVETERFLPPGDEWAGRWAIPPHDWAQTPEERLLEREAGACLAQAIAALPPAQRAVITLRDVDGYTADEVCRVLDLSPTNQRVLLHRARAKVRRALAQYLEGD